MLNQREQASLAWLGLVLLAGFAVWLKCFQVGGHQTPNVVSAGQAAGWERKLAESREVDVNTASVAELERLPGIGPALAARIVKEREEHGPFSSVLDITRVSGISEKTVESIRRRLKAR